MPELNASPRSGLGTADCSTGIGRFGFHSSLGSNGTQGPVLPASSSAPILVDRRCQALHPCVTVAPLSESRQARLDVPSRHLKVIMSSVPGLLMRAVLMWAFLLTFLAMAREGRQVAGGGRQPETPNESYFKPTIKLHQPPPLAPVGEKVFVHGRRSGRQIALTFDACSTQLPGRYDDRITQVLVETATPATLFLGGKWMEEHAGQTKRLSTVPFFELANHAFGHNHLSTLPDERIVEELRWNQAVMYSLTGRQPTLFRPPYGECDVRVARIASALGLRCVTFDLASGDPDPKLSKENIVDYVSQMARSGSVIVMHINGRGWHTAQTLPEIIARLRSRSFTFVTVSQLISAADTPEDRQVRNPETPSASPCLFDDRLDDCGELDVGRRFEMQPVSLVELHPRVARAVE
jgi:peptidoglycan-N-acetylglucosamine deacetylase